MAVRPVPVAVRSTVVIMRAVSFGETVREEHADHVVNQPGPAVSAGIVGNLLVDETGHQRGPHVEVSGVVDAGLFEPLTGDVEGADGRRVGLG